MKIENNNNYYNVEDEINFEKLKNFRKFNSNVKSITQSNDRNIRYANSDKNYFNNIIKTDENLSLSKKIDTEFNYSSNDYGEFNKIIPIKNSAKKIISNKNSNVKIIDYSKLNDNKKNLKNKLQIEKIKIVYFD